MPYFSSLVAEMSLRSINGVCNSSAMALIHGVKVVSLRSTLLVSLSSYALRGVSVSRIGVAPLALISFTKRRIYPPNV